MYKFETHLHTKSCSACAVSSGEEMVDAAVKAGYSGFVITNHFYHGNSAVDRSLSWADFVGAYAEDYYKTREYAEKSDFTVLFGIEEVYAPGKEVLIYGLEPEIIAANSDFRDYSISEIYDFVRKNGGLSICAHPFRHREYIPDPDTVPPTECFDGIEAYNLRNESEDNVRAFILAFDEKKIMISGGDVHNAGAFGGAGIEFDTPVNNNAEFVEKIKKGDFRLVTPYEKI